MVQKSKKKVKKNKREKKPLLTDKDKDRILDKIEKTGVQDAVLGATFLGLTVAYKCTKLGFIPQMLVPNADISVDLTNAGNIIRYLASGGMLKVLWGIDVPWAEEPEIEEQIDDKIADLETEIPITKQLLAEKQEEWNNLPPGAPAHEWQLIKAQIYHYKKLLAKQQKELRALKRLRIDTEIISWLVAMGMAGCTIYFMQETNMTELVQAVDIL